MGNKRNIKLLKRNLLWILFIGFSLYAIWQREDEFIFVSQSQYALGKYIVWTIFFCFLAYSIYASTKENFFKTLSLFSKKFWGWQIGIDLYIGLLLPLVLISLHGGILVFLIWLIPVLIYANLATLLYLALNYDSLVSHFII
ncbi:hypothetical protein [Winogradskyella sp. A2]|uniref:hypothetical protein n=1 Tax=Winogradskyella sp. A2 TaxID=3366944 RepID=UPI00398C7DB8